MTPDYNKCPEYNNLPPDWQKGYREDGCIYPYYGLAPHKHIKVDYKGHEGIGTKILDKSEWPENFIEDKEAEGCGTYICPYNKICEEKL